MSTAQASTATHTIHALRSPGAGHVSHHISHLSESLCGQPPGEPRRWPAGHLCVRWEPGQVLPPVVNCPACIQRYQDHAK